MTDKEFREHLIDELTDMGLGGKRWHWTRYISLGTLVILIISALSVQDWASRADERIKRVEQEQFTTGNATVLQIGIQQNSKDIKKNNDILKENGRAVYKLQQTIDRYIGNKIEY